MKNRITQISVIFLTMAVSACFDPPEFENEPKIRFRSLQYIDYPDRTEGARDSLILRFEFEDGDGNIGLDDRFTFFPFHSDDLVIDSQDSLVRYSNAVVPPLYLVDPDGISEPRLFSDTDNRPAYNDCDYMIVGNDTLYKRRNEYSRNFHIDFYRKRDGAYTRIDFQKFFGSGKCEQLTFDGRIPIFNPEGQGKAMTGTINYDMYSSLWELALSTDTFKIEFLIFDRTLNASNVAVSPDLTLPDITSKRN